MTERNILALIIFLVGIYTLTSGKKRAMSTAWLAVLVCALIVWKEKGAIEMLVYIGLLTPALYITTIKDKSGVKQRHSSIQEKAIAYLAVLPTFGFYFLFREKIEEKLFQIELNTSLVNTLEVSLFVTTLLAIYLFVKNRSRLC